MSLNKFSWCIATLSHLETLPVSFSLFHLRLWPGGSGTIYPLSPNRLTLPKTALYAKKHMHTTANSYRCIVILTASRSPTRNTHLGFSRRMASTYPKGLGCLSGILFCYLSDTDNASERYSNSEWHAAFSEGISLHAVCESRFLRGVERHVLCMIGYNIAIIGFLFSKLFLRLLVLSKAMACGHALAPYHSCPLATVAACFI